MAGRKARSVKSLSKHRTAACSSSLPTVTCGCCNRTTSFQKTLVPGRCSHCQRRDLRAVQAAGRRRFQGHKTAHYVIIFNTSESTRSGSAKCTRGCTRRFHNFWKSKKVELEEPGSRWSRSSSARKKITWSTPSARSVRLRRSISATTTQHQSHHQLRFDGSRWSRRKHAIELNTVDLAGARAAWCERTLATCVHEAVHQLAFNTACKSAFPIRRAGSARA